MTVKTIGTGLLFGLVAGAALAVLLAPRRGTDTREVIKEKAVELKERAGLMTGQIRQTTEDARRRGELRMAEIRQEAENP